MPRPPRLPDGAPKSFLWTRRVVLTLLRFVLTPVYVMLSSSLKRLQDVQGTSGGYPARSPSGRTSTSGRPSRSAHYFVNSVVVCDGRHRCCR